MRDDTHHLLRVRGLLSAAIETIDRLADDAPPAEDQRAIVAQTTTSIADALPRTRADVLRFVEAIQGGDEAWLVVHSVPGEHRIEAAYASKLSKATRNTLGI